MQAGLFQSRRFVMLSEAKHLLCRAARPFATLRVTSSVVDELVSCRCQGKMEKPYQYREMPYKCVSDEQLLESMHKARAKSRYLPAEARAESQRWLGEHARDA
jgi:hypothetical protein